MPDSRRSSLQERRRSRRTCEPRLSRAIRPGRRHSILPSDAQWTSESRSGCFVASQTRVRSRPSLVTATTASTKPCGCVTPPTCPASERVVLIPCTQAFEDTSEDGLLICRVALVRLPGQPPLPVHPDREHMLQGTTLPVRRAFFLLLQSL